MKVKYYSISPAACHGGAGSASFVFFHDSVLACFLFVVGGVNLPPKKHNTPQPLPGVCWLKQQIAEEKRYVEMSSATDCR